MSNVTFVFFCLVKLLWNTAHVKALRASSRSFTNTQLPEIISDEDSVSLSSILGPCKVHHSASRRACSGPPFTFASNCYTDDLTLHVHGNLWDEGQRTRIQTGRLNPPRLPYARTDFVTDPPGPIVQEVCGVGLGLQEREKIYGHTRDQLRRQRRWRGIQIFERIKKLWSPQYPSMTEKLLT